jgi:hypothetical protein
MPFRFLKGHLMRGLVRSIIATAIVLAASPAWPQRYDPAYPVCKEVVDSDGPRMECFYTSMEQCRQGGQGTAGTCLSNPYYRPSPTETTPAAEPLATPAPTPAKKKKR